jgi:hypothetical protein
MPYNDDHRLYHEANKINCFIFQHIPRHDHASHLVSPSIHTAAAAAVALSLTT